MASGGVRLPARSISNIHQHNITIFQHHFIPITVMISPMFYYCILPLSMSSIIVIHNRLLNDTTVISHKLVSHHHQTNTKLTHTHWRKCITSFHELTHKTPYGRLIRGVSAVWIVEQYSGQFMEEYNGVSLLELNLMDYSYFSFNGLNIHY